MSKPNKGSALYRLIEAGQLARLAVTRPLPEFGLEPGDDAVLFLLGDRRGLTDAELGDALGRNPEALAPFIGRLAERGLVARQAFGPGLALGLALTEYGEAVRERLTDHWSEVEAAILAELPPRRRKILRRALKSMVVRLLAGLTERETAHPAIDEGHGSDDGEGEDDQPC